MCTKETIIQQTIEKTDPELASFFADWFSTAPHGKRLVFDEDDICIDINRHREEIGQREEVNEKAEQVWQQILNGEKIKWRHHIDEYIFETTGIKEEFLISVSLLWGQDLEEVWKYLEYRIRISLWREKNDTCFIKRYRWSKLKTSMRISLCDILFGEQLISAMTHKIKYIRQVAKWYAEQTNGECNET